jgi:outer membrane lipoprotein-sorting protein
MDDNERYIEDFVGDVPFEGPDSDHRDRLKKQLLAEFPKHRHESTVKTVGIWSTLMKSTMTKMAAAAVVVFAVLVGVSVLFNGSVTFAQVIEPILNARTLVFDIFMGDEETGTKMHEIVSGSRIRRTISNMPNLTQIIDLDSGQMLVLDSDSNGAMYVDIEGSVRDNTENYVAFVRDTIVRLQETARAVKLGEAEIDGVNAVGFSLGGRNEKLIVWADPETAYPLRIELRLGQLDAVMKNFEFDVELDESAMSMDVPAGYTLQEETVELSDASEADFVESLRIWAEILGDGVFPEAIGTEATMQQMPMLVQKLMEMNVSEQEGTQAGMNFAKGMLFHQMLDMQGLDYGYAGAGVELGDAETAVFWYQPAGSQMYRVVYGDLSVQDATEDDVPK